VKPAIRLLALDIDGTLLDQHFQVSPRNIEALKAAHEAGIQVMLATGRRHDYALPIARQLGIPVSLISSNGALVRFSNGERFHADRLPAATAKKLIGHMDEYRSNAVLTFDRQGPDALVLERADELSRSIARWIEKNSGHIRYVVPLEAALTEDPIQAMYCGGIERMQAVQQRLAEAEFFDEITVLRTQYDQRDLCIIDILNRGCTKGHALRRWADHHGIAPAEVMAIGDNYNDLEMLEFAGLPVIMGNASEDLKSRGWTLTASNLESGVALAVERVLRAGIAPSIEVK
jgi:Cof subfamily protein (haloacid dehalogenase superfamily)